jgi:mono/diheme cytochrome c family protein
MKSTFLPGLAGLLALLLSGCTKSPPHDSGGGRVAADFADLAEDVFSRMDGGIQLSPDEIKGRNTWNLWCGGNEQFWDRMTRDGHGLFDLLHMLDSRERGTRFSRLGLINQPGYRTAAKPDKYGVWLDEPVSSEAAEPAAIDPKVFGRASGVMGFRIFDNPDFTGPATNLWDPERFYDPRDTGYSMRRDVIRPYRVGISCGSCHIAFHPCFPPEDPENPKWENLASAIGNQYIREGRVFAPNVRKGGFFYEMIEVQPPGTSDTSRIATDHINNPNTINPIFLLGSRLAVAEEEVLEGQSVLLPGNSNRMAVPHVLKDGADSVGVPGATLRVYVNIGMYSQHWLQQHNPLIGVTRQKPFSIEAAFDKSVFWQATATKFQNIAKFFTRIRPYRLEDAPGGSEYITRDDEVMNRGKVVFATHCAECHSSKRPPPGTPQQEEWFRQEIMEPDFRDDNFFSDDRRHSVAKIGTNAGRAAATNAKKGHVWEHFSSATYKQLPQIAPINVFNPYTDQWEKFQIPGGGPGYYRTPSLVSLWSSAPFLHNNALGRYTGDPSVKGRMEAFQDAVEKLLWPEKRLGVDSIWRTTNECALQLHVDALPKTLRTVLLRLDRLDVSEGIDLIESDGTNQFLRIGRIPAGTPVNLIANIDPDRDWTQLARLLLKIKSTVAEVALRNLDSGETKALMRERLAADLFAASKCPDLITDRGHEFGTELPDADKHALIEYLKTL